MSTEIQFSRKYEPVPAENGWLNRRTVAWASYDVASSAYFGVAPAVLLPVYFGHLLSGFANPTAAWGALASLAILASGLAALGAAHLSVRLPRFTLLVAFSAGLVAAQVVLAWNPWSSLILAALAYVAAQSFYFAASTVYESFLPDLLPGSGRQKLSGFGWAVGYTGGLVSIGVLLLLVSGQTESPRLIETCFAALAIIGALLFAPVFVLMQRAGFRQLGGGSTSAPLSGVLGVISRWRRHRDVFRLLVGTMLVHAAVSVVVTFTAPILASRFGQALQDLLWLLLLIHVLSVPSTLLWSQLMARWSRAVLMALLLLAWGAVLLLLAFGTGAWIPVAVVSAIGCCVGGTASTLRGLLAESVDPGSSAAFFGLATVSGRLAAALGPAVFALVTAWGGERTALLVILAILAAGAALVLMHLRRGEPAAGLGAAG